MEGPPPPASAPRQVLLTVWFPRPGAFAAYVLLSNGTRYDFDSPFELVRFLSRPPAPPSPASGLR